MMINGGPNPADLPFDLSLFQNNHSRGLPEEFVWPHKDLAPPHAPVPPLDMPLIDLGGFLSGDEGETSRAIELMRAACMTHGFFLVTGHGVDRSLVDMAHDAADCIFRMPMSRKMGMRRKQGSFWGYSVAHSDRFSSNLPWKETFSFGFGQSGRTEGGNREIVDYFTNVVGTDVEHLGLAYQKYCEAMKEVGLAIMELIAMSLGLEKGYYRRIFEKGSSIMRCNYYPPCERQELTLGTGPHCDPTSLTILHQDQVGGLQVFVDGKWQAVMPPRDAFVVNVGDTLMAMTNGMYKSCLHRAVVNRVKERRSLVFFMCPSEDQLISPPPHLLRLDTDHIGRKYPDFKWSQLLNFTQSHYRADVSTLQSFIQTLPSPPATP
ncbi:hypothetical protein MLD38_003252 [Melastoma candidum]|uniref:Uncharacterized protein n=1 Tax=Melastoma candidum TaxID=119954 RepID=A0ACB9S251_9MYRT|nr:hypothetical protein MLD38_003252 [Melastoma candidum]